MTIQIVSRTQSMTAEQILSKDTEESKNSPSGRNSFSQTVARKTLPFRREETLSRTWIMRGEPSCWVKDEKRMKKEQRE